MFFTCKACQAKDQHIADLKEQLAAMTAMVKGVVNPVYSKAVESEMNFALDGASTEQVSAPTEEQRREISAVEQQALELLTGTYS